MTRAGDERIRLPRDVDVAAVAKLRSAVADVLHQGPSRLTLDLRDVEFIDSVGLGLLVSTRRRCLDDDVALELEGVGDAVHRLLEMTGLVELFRLTPAR